MRSRLVGCGNCAIAFWLFGLECDRICWVCGKVRSRFSCLGDYAITFWFWECAIAFIGFVGLMRSRLLGFVRRCDRVLVVWLGVRSLL
ncbi:hypothetical protein [Brunnivagina elsteri]|uniref:hypothetical protein n=1 Tax=Brunnivagina elsteri TaxID=1247191 RepID=UPI0011782975|nr:hypothetical protein [Calothrix elsteri]